MLMPICMRAKISKIRTNIPIMPIAKGLMLFSPWR
jgi:hypothetical protein